MFKRFAGALVALVVLVSLAPAATAQSTTPGRGTWSAIAVGVGGQFTGQAQDAETRQDALQSAIDSCRWLQQGKDNCPIAFAFQDKCAVVFMRDDLAPAQAPTQQDVFFASAATDVAARNQAASTCQRRLGKRCVLIAQLCVQP
ncbi:MAG: DUF4189 domain-containing protein [Alphaproteobacteria bacterium]